MRIVERTESVRWVTLPEGTVRLGRASDNDVILAGVAASGHHARIRLSAAGVRIRDLGSRNGTFVNGRRVEAARLAPGDSIRMGDAHLTLVA